jgi:hypothetical protein
MTMYSPCLGCARKPSCETLASVRKAVAGNGAAISVVKVNCHRAYEADFPIGTRVRVRANDWHHTISLKARRSLAGYSATVFGWRSTGRLLILLDDTVYWDEEDEVGMCRLQSVQHRDVELLGEELRGSCSDCGALLDLEGKPVRWMDSRSGMKGGCQYGMGCDREPYEPAAPAIAADDAGRPF